MSTFKASQLLTGAGAAGGVLRARVDLLSRAAHVQPHRHRGLCLSLALSLSLTHTLSFSRSLSLSHTHPLSFSLAAATPLAFILHSHNDRLCVARSVSRRVALSLSRRVALALSL